MGISMVIQYGDTVGGKKNVNCLVLVPEEESYHSTT